MEENLLNIVCFRSNLAKIGGKVGKDKVIKGKFMNYSKKNVITCFAKNKVEKI